jgi:hypothetical protein
MFYYMRSGAPDEEIEALDFLCMSAAQGFPFAVTTSTTRRRQAWRLAMKKEEAHD